MENKYTYYVNIILDNAGSSIKGLYTFNKGEEIDLVNVLKEFNQNYKSNDDKYKPIVKNAVKSIIYSSKDNLDINKLWDYLNLDIIRDSNIELFDYVLQNIHFDDFMNKVNRSKDFILVCYYYIKYAKVNNLFKEDVMKHFDTYLDNYVDVNGLNYDKFLDKLYSIEKLNKDYENRGLSVEESIAYIVHHSIGKISDTKFSWIMQKFSTNTPYGVKMVKKILKEYPDIFFTDTDRVLLNVYIRNSEEAAKIFNSDEYKLYDDAGLNQLINNGRCCVVTDRFGHVISAISWATRKERGPGGFQKKDINSIIYSDKIKIISFDSIRSIKAILKEEDFNKFMLHVIDDGIVVYDRGYGNNTTAKYAIDNMPKNRIKEGIINQEKLDLLERSQYVKVKE